MRAVLNMYNFEVRPKQPAVISTWGQLAIDEAQLTDAFVGDGLALFRTENFGGLRVADLNITDEFGPGAVYISPVALAGVSANSGVFCNDKTQVHVSAFGPPEPCQPLNKVQDEDAFASANDVWFTATREVRRLPLHAWPLHGWCGCSAGWVSVCECMRAARARVRSPARI